MGELLAKILELLPDWVGWSLIVLVVGGLGWAWLTQIRAARRPPAGPAAPGPRPPAAPPAPPPG